MKFFRSFQLLASFVAAICVTANALPPEEATNRDNFNDARTLEGEEYDCDNGCNLDPDEMGPPVCGVDDLTYFNKCIAICQGIEVAKEGPCVDHSSERGPDDSYEKDGRVDAEVLRRFESEGLKFVGKRKFIYYDPMEIERAEAMKGKGKPKRGKKRGKLFFRAHRIVPEGYEYVANIQKPSKSKLLEDLPPFDNKMDEKRDEADMEYDDEGDGRHLVVLGQDTRRKVTSVTSFPYRVAGELDYGNVGRCSGTVIGKRAVVTAGHCLYNNGILNNHSTFAPGRTRVNGRIISPYGKFAWSQINYFIAWRNNEVREYDIAVVKYYPNSSGRYLGDVVGYAGLRGVSSASPYLDKCQIRGYPGDKPDGEMWTSGTCPGGFGPYFGKSKIAKYFCDTAPGMSGSGLMDASGYVHGVHSFSNSKYQYNGGIVLSGTHYDYVRKWAER